MIHLVQSRQVKPNRIERSEESKEKDYHLEYARWVIGNASNMAWQHFETKYKVNREFYKNNQWIHSEDTEAFFMDESGQDRHRIKVTKNYIQPMVEQYRGNAERMKIDYKIQNVSPLAKSRKDRMLAKLLNYDMASRNNAGMRDAFVQEGIPLGANRDETQEKFENTYTDEYVVAGNRLLRSVAELNKIDSLKSKWAMDLALGGVAVAFPYPYGGDWRFERVIPYQWGFDTTAQSETLDDSEYFWRYELMSPTSIYEQFQDISDTSRANIESHIANSASGSYVANMQTDTGIHGKVPVYTAIWRDVVVDTFGYVKDEFGQVILARINYVEFDQEEPKYKEKDVLPIKGLSPYQKRVLRGKKMRNLYVDNWRYAKFIPNEVIGSGVVKGKYKDIVLDYGVLPYQEPNLFRPTNMEPPFKVGMWSYVDGEILSPVDVAINPQRMINRFMSVMENQINNSTGAGTVYDRDALSEDDEDEFLVKMQRGEAVGIHARGRGVQNFIGRYDGMPKESLAAFNGLIESFKAGMEDTTGVNEGLKGNTENPDQLVGVMQLMIQRGSIIQEPFYKALTDVYKGCYQNIITSGRRFYIDNDLDLEDFVGEDEAMVIKLTKDMRNENLRIAVVRTIDSETERMYTDQQITMWLQFGLLDPPTAASLIGKATYNEAIMALRTFHKQLMMRQREAEKQQQVLMQQQQNAQDQAGQVLYGEKLREEAREDINKQMDRETKLETSRMKQP